MTETRISRRQVLAAIALADAPAPQEITFRKDGVNVTIDLDRIAEIRPWAKVFGASVEHVKNAINKPLRYTHNGRSMVSVSLYTRTWRGWEICLHADEYADKFHVEPLDEETRAKLAEVAAGGEAA
jgi:hypothetical protein